MAYRQILPITDPMLRAPSAPIAEITDEVKALAADMVDTMIAVQGAGLAAVQVGAPVRLVVLDLRPLGGRVMTMVNPEIVERSEAKQNRREGCLSMPGEFFEVERARQVIVRYSGLDGAERQFEAQDFSAVAVQHELDHLDGVRHVDHLSPLKRAMILKSFDKRRVRPRR